MYSFPKLESRNCTNDWIAPPGQNEEAIVQPATVFPDFYRCGIDAHSGWQPLKLTQDNAAMSCRTRNLAWQHQGSRQGETIEMPDRKHSAATDEGPSSYQRNSVVSPNNEADPGNSSPLIETLRQYSFLPLQEQPPENLRKTTSTLRNSVPGEELFTDASNKRKRSSKELLEDILRKSSWYLDNNRIRKRGSHASTSSLQVYRGSTQVHHCMEDHTPHICMDEE
ncbi:hypothetical protein BX600DRAFT_539576 [Xylariales sp. PMI_506]|nr:hypothetical protein BX600DRAFT_539576 [Xylariales sp. PMI_506]